MGEHYLGDKGTVKHTRGKTVKVKDVNQPDNWISCGTKYFPEKKTNPNGVALKGSNPGGNYMGDWFAHVRDCRQPNTNVEIGYLAAMACHMSNLEYKEKCRITLEEAMAAKPEALM
jgi:hypothetical protein